MSSSSRTTTLSKVSNSRQGIGTRDKTVRWYKPTLSKLSSTQRDLLENYSHITAAGVIPHIQKIRDLAWEVHPYPCIGQFHFLDLSLSRSPSYPSVLKRLAAGSYLLDLGCCFAQDLRKLVRDGAPATNLYGVDMYSEFIELGYSLFLDKDSIGAHFIVGDLFNEEGPLKPLEGWMDMIQIGFFLHLFDWEGQIAACGRIVTLLRAEKGSLILGQQVGSVQAGEVPTGGQRMMYKHDVKSFVKLWREVGKRTGTKWEVRAWFDEKKTSWDDSHTRRLVFEVERLG